MQRLTRELFRGRERGATAVTFALLTTLMIGFMGLGVDGAAVYAKRQHVQTAADAAAFALAQQYALTSCVEDSSLALKYALPNIPHDSASTKIDEVDCGTDSTTRTKFVRVDVSSEQPPFFLQAVGAGPIRVPASATVEWGSPVEGTSVMPIAISYCSYFDNFGDANVGDTVNLRIPRPSDHSTGCSYHSSYPPGGFSWLDPSGGCKAFTKVGGWVGGDTGSSVPSACSISDFRPLVGQTFLLPVFDKIRGTGSSGEYKIHGYAAVVMKGFYFGNLSGGTKGAGAACTGWPSGTKMCMLLEFQGYVTMDEEFTLGPITDPNNLVIRLKD